jgi:hypothetical protein
MIISDEPKLFEILEEYEETNNEDQFKDRVLAVIRPKGMFHFLMRHNFYHEFISALQAKIFFHLFER